MKLKFISLVIISLCAVATGLTQDVSAETALSKGYMLGPGDEITGKVQNEADYDFLTTVDQNGKIEVPFSDKPIIAKCRTETQLRVYITEILKKELRNPRLSLRVTAQKSRPPATIYGEVNSPQQVILMRKATLTELLAIAGGPKEEAGGMIQIFRTQPPICAEDSGDSNWNNTGSPAEAPSRLYSLSSVKMGKPEANPIIYPGDVIVVQKAAPVYITGEVLAPQGIYLKEGGLSLTEAIAKIGGVNREAKTKDIKIYRLKSNSKDREILKANYDMIKKGQQGDIMLEPYDIVEVDKAKENVASMILKFALGAGKAMVTSGATNVGYRVIY